MIETIIDIFVEMRMNANNSITEVSDDGTAEEFCIQRQRYGNDKDQSGDHDESMIKILEDLSRRQTINSTDEDPLDPIEWTVRKLIPIPETYFWDYSPNGEEGVVLDGEWKNKLPRYLKAWHRTIGMFDSGMQWIDRWIAQPVATGTGLTASRMSYVTDFMTEEEWETSRQRLRERKGRVLHDSETGDGFVMKTTAGQLVQDDDRVGLESLQISSEER